MHIVIVEIINILTRAVIIIKWLSSLLISPLYSEGQLNVSLLYTYR